MSKDRNMNKGRGAGVRDEIVVTTNSGAGPEEWTLRRHYGRPSGHTEYGVYPADGQSGTVAQFRAPANASPEHLAWLTSRVLLAQHPLPGESKESDALVTPKSLATLTAQFGTRATPLPLPAGVDPHNAALPSWAAGKFELDRGTGACEETCRYTLRLITHPGTHGVAVGSVEEDVDDEASTWIAGAHIRAVTPNAAWNTVVSAWEASALADGIDQLCRFVVDASTDGHPLNASFTAADDLVGRGIRDWLTALDRTG